MRKHIALLAATACVAAYAAPVASQRARNPEREAQASARQEMQAGREMAPRDIERRIIPQMRGSDYLGFEYDDAASAYRLKFLKDGQVTWVDVDARTGRVLRVSR
jgi:hypothetical protein